MPVPRPPGFILEHLELRTLLAGTGFQTIQAAIDAAAPGSTITVAAGTYDELLKINKPLILKGAHAGVDARDNSRGTGESIIRGQDLGSGNRSTGFYVTANGVTIDGFVVQDDASTNVYGAGIVLAPGVHGTHIVNNIVQSNVAGMYLANSSSADPCLIQHNVFQNNNNAGDHSGLAIFTNTAVSGGVLSNVVIDSNTFINNVGFGPPAHPVAAISFDATGGGKQSNITITSNTLQGNGKAVFMHDIDKVMIAGNLITASTDAGSAAIRIEGNASNVTIQANTITGNLGAAIKLSKEFGAANSAISVTGNNLFGNTGGGLIVDAGAYSGTLNATNDWWGSATGPGGIGGGFGDAITAPDHNVNFTPFATKLLGADSGGGGGTDTADDSTPRGLRQILINDLAAIRDGTSGRIRHFLNDAIANFKASLDASLWIDDSHLAPGAGETLFKLDAKALKQLRKAIKTVEKKSDLPDGIRQTIQRITNLERMMAMIAIDSASSGKANKLRKANHELSAGVNEVNRGNYAQAIGHFLAAWKFAIQAGHKKHHKAHEPKPTEGDHEKRDGEDRNEGDDKNEKEDHDD